MYGSYEYILDLVNKNRTYVDKEGRQHTNFVVPGNFNDFKKFNEECGHLFINGTLNDQYAKLYSTNGRYTKCGYMKMGNSIFFDRTFEPDKL